MKRHACPTCGLRHDSPKAWRIIRPIVFAVFFGTIEVLAALRLDGFLSWSLWVIAAWNAVLLTLVVIGSANLAAGNLAKPDGAS